jgi:hypothetical protein
MYFVVFIYNLIAALQGDVVFQLTRPTLDRKSFQCRIKNPYTFEAGEMYTVISSFEQYYLKIEV